MKTAYELAMERLSKSAPTVKLSSEQKSQIAELESQCGAKLAERELLLKDEMTRAVERGDEDAVAQIDKQMVSDRKTIRANFEEKKDKVRNQNG
ncbi:MAG: hypothetical protein NTX27_00880 [Verrucomicrobia bacterium]|nr:hypothetical protein [Verrucomicrobiota bacterium]